MLESFFSLQPELLTAIATVLGFASIDDLTSDQQNTLGNFLMLIGQVLETNSAQKQLLSDIRAANRINQLECRIAHLEKTIAKLTEYL